MSEPFYDCGAYGLWTLPTEGWQPTVRGKLASPEGFAPNPNIPINDPIWTTYGPIVRALDGNIRVVDVGGYIGTFTIPMALAAKNEGYRLRFDVFEPGPTRHVLARNFAINQLDDRVTLHDAAVSAKVGEATYRWRANGAIGGQVFAMFDTNQERTVTTTTIDTICRGWDGPLLIKLDTQGHEAGIMAAARETIAGKKAVWQIEFIHKYVQDDFNPGQPFYRYIFDEFHVFEHRKPIAAADADAFMANLIATKKYGTTDLLLVPKASPITDVCLKALHT